jgi:hypothetical protein
MFRLRCIISGFESENSSLLVELSKWSLRVFSGEGRLPILTTALLGNTATRLQKDKSESAQTMKVGQKRCLWIKKVLRPDKEPDHPWSESRRFTNLWEPFTDESDRKPTSWQTQLSRKIVRQYWKGFGLGKSSFARNLLTFGCFCRFFRECYASIGISKTARNGPEVSLMQRWDLKCNPLFLELSRKRLPLPPIARSRTMSWLMPLVFSRSKTTEKTSMWIAQECQYLQEYRQTDRHFQKFIHSQREVHSENGWPRWRVAPHHVLALYSVCGCYRDHSISKHMGALSTHCSTRSVWAAIHDLQARAGLFQENNDRYSNSNTHWIWNDFAIGNARELAFENHLH